MTAEEYWNSLNEDQKRGFHYNLMHADNHGIDIVIYDAIDIWYMLPEEIRGERPLES